jgi:hypothetical protein
VLGPKLKEKVYYFPKYFSVPKQFWKSLDNILYHENTQKIPKILGKFPETYWDMKNPNKVFGAHEKDFRVF